MTDLFELPARATVPVLGEDGRFPVHRIFCVGRNYEAHAREMGFSVDRDAPFYFTKTPSAICPTGATTPYPPGTEITGCVLPRLALGLTAQGSLVGLFGYSVQT